MAAAICSHEPSGKGKACAHYVREPLTHLQEQGSASPGRSKPPRWNRDDANSDNTIDNKIEIPQAAGTSRRKQTWLGISRFFVHDLTQIIKIKRNINLIFVELLKMP
jgi:hypothetical protein